MSYTIAQAAEMTGLSIYTIRYYDKEGLLPFIERTTSKARIFRDSDIEWINLICCLKNTGMQIKQIKIFINWCMEGDSTLEKRLQMFLDHKQAVLNQIQELENNLKTIDYKIWYYKTSFEAGTEKVHKDHHWERAAR